MRARVSPACSGAVVAAVTRRAARVIAVLALSMLAGCSVAPGRVADTRPLDPGRLPPPTATLEVAHLRSCTDAPDRALHLDPDRPVTVLVHGCDASAGRFRSLAQLYAFHGQQAVCFEYDDRRSLVRVADELTNALDELAARTRSPRLTVIGHSMGGLVARKAMEQVPARATGAAEVRLATVSAPIAGIRSARACASGLLRWLTLGAMPGLCWMITGDNWTEITAASPFIREPAPLDTAVRSYLKVVTDERGTCRRRNARGACVESDHVFTLDEQYHPVIERYPRLVNVEVDAGHAAIVGTADRPPVELVSVLQRHGLLAATPPARRDALRRLLAQLY